MQPLPRSRSASMLCLRGRLRCLWASRRSAMLVRKARLQDATNVYELVNSLSHDGTLLRRPFAEICENIRDFTIAETEAGIFLGCSALHFYGPHLAEVRSMGV